MTQPQPQQPQPQPQQPASVNGQSNGSAQGSSAPPRADPSRPLPSTSPTNAPAASQVAQVQAQAATVAASQPPPQAPAFRIVKPARAVRWFKGLFYGPYGAGKTTLAATSDDVPDMQDVMLADVEAGDLSVIHRDFDVVPIGEYRQIARLYEYLRAHVKARDEDNVLQLRKWEAYFKGIPVPTLGSPLAVTPQPVTQPGPGGGESAPSPQQSNVVTESYLVDWYAENIPKPRKYRTLIVDSLSELDRFLMYQLLGIKVGQQRLDAETQQPEWAEWGRNAEMLRLLIRSMRDLPMNIIFVCSANIQEDDRKRQIYRPNLPGKLGGECQGFMDCVGYLVAYPGDNGALARRLYITPGQTYDAKNRFVGFNETFIQDPTMATIWDLVMRYYKAPTPVLNAPSGRSATT